MGFMTIILILIIWKS